MLCLSIQPPWSFCITNGSKRVENRTWVPNAAQRQRLLHEPSLIHAGKTYQTGIEFAINRNSPEMDVVAMQRAPRGAIVGIAQIVSFVHDVPQKLCRVAGCNRHDVEYAQDQIVWAGGTYGFVYDRPRAFITPSPYRGQLKFFEVPDELVTRQIAAIERKRKDYGMLEKAAYE